MGELDATRERRRRMMLGALYSACDATPVGMETPVSGDLTYRGRDFNYINAISTLTGDVQFNLKTDTSEIICLIADDGQITMSVGGDGRLGNAELFSVIPNEDFELGLLLEGIAKEVVRLTEMGYQP